MLLCIKIYALNLQHTLEADWVLGTLGSTLLQGPLHPGSPKQHTAHPKANAGAHWHVPRTQPSTFLAMSSIVV